MRISFDLDDTLITTSCEWPVERDTPDFLGRGQRLRLGTIDLFRWLRERGHEIWIYTNSYRGWKDLELWFEACGAPVDVVVNRVRHDLERAERNPAFRGEKNPSWFDIDLHVDDQDAMVDLASSVGVRALKLEPDDPDWVGTVRGQVESMEAAQ